VLERFRRLYGTDPLHLLALLASFAIVGAGLAGWLQRSFDLDAVLVWFVVAILAQMPLYSLLDLIAFGRRGTQPQRAPLGAPSGVPYIRIPALLSGLLLLVFFPLILALGSGTFHAASGHYQGGYLARWLLATGVLFALSGIAYARALARMRRTRAT